MKKVLMAALLLAGGFAAQAQVTSLDLENWTIPAPGSPYIPGTPITVAFVLEPNPSTCGSLFPTTFSQTFTGGVTKVGLIGSGAVGITLPFNASDYNIIGAFMPSPYTSSISGTTEVGISVYSCPPGPTGWAWSNFGTFPANWQLHSDVTSYSPRAFVAVVH